MLATPKMKQYYRKYGEFCYFKIYRNYIQKDAVSWEIAFFTGMDLTNRPLHLAVGFLRIDSPL